MKNINFKCTECSKLFDYADYAAAYTADEKTNTICIDCQLKDLKEKENEDL